jgi:nucleotide-binding universal stress UspA family protein
MSPLHLIGYDGSHAARAALDWGTRLAEATGADVLVVNVFDTAPHTGVRGVAMPGADLVEADVRRAAQRRMDEIDPGVRREVHAARSAAQGLHEVAEAEGASMIVVGRTHVGSVSRRVRGSVAGRLLHGAPCPVAVVPEGEPRDLEVIAVAYDATSEAENALAFATGLAADLGARLLLLGVVEPGPFAHPEASPEMWRSLHRHRSGSLEHAADRCREHGLDVTTRLLEGDPADELAAAAAQDADLLVTGSRSFGPLRATVAGSTSSKLADRAPCPTVVVPRGVAVVPRGAELSSTTRSG